MFLTKSVFGNGARGQGPLMGPGGCGAHRLQPLSVGLVPRRGPVYPHMYRFVVSLRPNNLFLASWGREERVRVEGDKKEREKWDCKKPPPPKKKV